MPAAASILGELAALGAAVCWVMTATAFTIAGRRIGPVAVNLIRIILAFLVLLLICRLRFGGWLPEVGTRSMLILGISGLLGLAIGDQFLFTALVDVGPRIATLVATTLAPPVAALVAFAALREPLAPHQALGMFITLAGIAWVILERRPVDAGKARNPRRGILFAVLGGTCQAVGLVLSKQGMGHGQPEGPFIDPWIAATWRMGFGMVGIMLLAGTLRRLGRAVPPPPPGGRGLAASMIVVGTIFGPVFGVWLSMVAVDRAETGPAATLMATTPIFILPVAVLVERERLSLRAVTGAVLAVVGVGVLTGGG